MLQDQKTESSAITDDAESDTNANDEQFADALEEQKEVYPEQSRAKETKPGSSQKKLSSEHLCQQIQDPDKQKQSNGPKEAKRSIDIESRKPTSARSEKQ